MSDEPIGWRVTGTYAPEKLSGTKTEPYVQDFQTKEAAEDWKRQKQAAGWVCCVTPIFMSKQAHGKARMKGQGRTAPKRFNKEWTLHGGRRPQGE